MAKLVFYTNEKDTFKTEHNIHFEDYKAELICHKLARHFDFRLEKIRFHGYRQTGYAWYSCCEIRLGHNPNLALLCHELAHIYNHQKFKNSHHNKKLLRTITKFLEYCKKKNYWLGEN